MKKLFSAAALAVAVLLSLPVAAQGTSRWQPLATAFSSAGTSTTAGSAIDVSGGTACMVHLVSTSTSSATFSVEGSLDGVTYWYPLATATNPTSTGEVWAGPCPRFLRFNPSAHASGTLKGYAAWRTMPSDPIGQSWKIVTAAANTFGAVTATSVTDSGLTSGRVPYAGSGGLLQDAAAFAYASGTLSATIHAGASQDTITAKSTDGAIASAPGTIVITKGSALGSSTLATPTTTTHDGYILRIVSSTGYAHVVSVASGKVNGGSNTTLTFGAQIGNSITLIAYQGVWYVLGNVGVTIS